MKLSQGSIKQVMRKQFPMVPAQAITSYKSQSSTYDKILVQASGMTRRHLYTSFSRAKSLGGLYIKGDYKPPPAPSVYDIAIPVIERMKIESPLKFLLPFPEENGHKYAMFHNIRSLNLYLPYVINHPSYMNADILMFVETRFKAGEVHDIPGYACVHRQDCVLPQRHPFGSALYVKHSESVSIFHHELDLNKVGTNLKSFLDITGYLFNQKAIIFLHKSPSYNISKFKSKLQKTLEKVYNLTETIIVGDFNLKQDEINQFMRENNLQMSLKGSFSTDYHTLIDLYYTSNPNHPAYLYESPISDHKPVWFTI